MAYHLGVDIGTTFTAAATLRPGGVPEMLGLGNRAMQIPSVVFLDAQGTFVVGEPAERRALADPGRAAREFKRRFGDHVPLLLGGSPFSAQLLTARVLSHVIEVATERLDEPPAAITVTHPAAWGGYRLELMQQALDLAGASSARLLPEPVAAALHYTSQTRVPVGSTVAVYDLGGGTFDICLLKKTAEGASRDSVRMLGSPQGIERLGGVDFDEAMFQLVAANLNTAGLDLDDPGTLRAMIRLKRDCVEAKESLSSDVDAAVPVDLPGLSTTVRVTRAELEERLRPVLAETVSAVGRALESAQLRAEELHSIVLCGGSSRIPLAGELLREAFAARIAVDTHPKHDICLGAVLADGLHDAAALESGDDPIQDRIPPVRESTESGPVGAGADAGASASASSSASSSAFVPTTGDSGASAIESQDPARTAPLPSVTAEATSDPSLLTDPAPTEPVPTNPAPANPAPTHLAPANPAPADQSPTRSARDEPTSSPPAPTDPMPVVPPDPARGAAGLGDSAASGAGISDPASTHVESPEASPASPGRAVAADRDGRSRRGRNRILIAAAAVVVLVLAVVGAIRLLGPGADSTAGSGSGASASPSTGPTPLADATVSIWLPVLNDAQQRGLDELLVQYQQENPGQQVQVTYYFGDDQKKALTEAVDSGSLPDVYSAWAAPAYGGGYVDDGLAAQLDSYYAQYGWDERFRDPLVAPYRREGSTYGTPWLIRGWALFYNKKLFADAGVSPGPTTVTELTELARQLDGAGITPFSVGAASEWHSARLLDNLVEAECGSDLTDRLTALEVTWDQECVASAFTIFRQYTTEFAHPQTRSLTQHQAAYEFAHGGAAMQLEGDDFLAQAVGEGLDADTTGVFLFPTGTGRQYAYSEGLYISAGSAHQDQAAALIDFLTSTPSQQHLQGLFSVSSVNAAVGPPTMLPQVEQDLAAVVASSQGYFANFDQDFDPDVRLVYYQVQSEVIDGTLAPGDAGRTFSQRVSG
ncbi:MAG: extracellular solute-binding protein [Actinomycetales bacterium]